MQKEKKKIGIREILSEHGEGYISKHKATAREKGLMRLLAMCSTHFLGSHATSCDKCGHTEAAYNPCRNRHCPNCQQKDNLEWISKRMKELLPVGYYHLVFTLPHQLNQFCLQNKKTMYGILFKSVSQTIMELAADTKHAGAQTGLICVLHTWGQCLTDHIHLHCLMPAGGLTNNNQDWLHFDKKDGFFVYYKVISRRFRKKFLTMMEAAFLKGEITCNGNLTKYKSKNVFMALTKNLSGIEWVANIQPPMGNPEKILEYLSRYVFRVAISDNRISSVKNGRVNFMMKDYRTGLFRPMGLDIDEFIHRFLLHILPERFLKVRHYGIFSNRYRKENIEKAKEILTMQNETAYQEALEDGGTVWRKQDTVWDEIKELIDSFKFPNCPCCKKGRMKFAGYIQPAIPFNPG
jgi:hypothetical protein